VSLPSWGERRSGTGFSHPTKEFHMAVKIKLGSRPKSFKKTISVPMHEGGEGQMEVSYIYRTRPEFGELVDGILESAGVRPVGPGEEDVKFSLREAIEKTRDANADYILRVIDGWNLDVPLDRAAVVQLCDELPAAAFAIINQYREAIVEGRLKN
jgi:hypothetical protein